MYIVDLEIANKYLSTNDNIIQYTNNTSGIGRFNFIWILQKTERFYFRHILLVE